MSDAISRGSGQLRALSISLMVSDRTRCNAGCRFCISRTTPGAGEQGDAVRLLDDRRLRIGLNYARHLEATHAILTGKADPTQEDEDYLCRLVSTAREYVPLVDMHTNGLLLQPGRQKEGLLEKLVDAGLTMITYSIASFNDVTNNQLMRINQNQEFLIRRAVELGLLVRCSLVMCRSGINSYMGVQSYVHQAGLLGAHMVVVREVWLPDDYAVANREVFDWNRENFLNAIPCQDSFRRDAQDIERPKTVYELGPLPWGTPVFVVGGGRFDDPEHEVNVTFARCGENGAGHVLKSIVHKPNGHGYRNWDHNGDILY